MTNIKAAPSVLVAENEPDLLNNLSLALETAGYQTLTASNGLEALAVLQTEPVDLILSDINMPIIGGYQFHKFVHESRRWSTTPFLFLTGCRFSSDEETPCNAAPDNDKYPTKPIQPEDLFSVVQKRVPLFSLSYTEQKFDKKATIAIVNSSEDYQI